MVAKYKIGQTVRVRHPTSGEWVGDIIYRANTDEEYWEYEVTNAPIYDGRRWFPLLWESEVVEVL